MNAETRVSAARARERIDVGPFGALAAEQHQAYGLQSLSRLEGINGVSEETWRRAHNGDSARRHLAGDTRRSEFRRWHHVNGCAGEQRVEQRLSACNQARR